MSKTFSLKGGHKRRVNKNKFHNMVEQKTITLKELLSRTDYGLLGMNIISENHGLLDKSLNHYRTKEGNVDETKEIPFYIVFGKEEFSLGEFFNIFERHFDKAVEKKSDLLIQEKILTDGDLNKEVNKRVKEKLNSLVNGVDDLTEVLNLLGEKLRNKEREIDW